MKLGFAPSIGFIFDFECVVDVDLAWELGTPHLIVNDVLESSGKVSLLHSDDKLMAAIAYRIADLAEDDTKLLARAVAQDNDEREAA
jgi:hypothetical protein